jgi:hypothetical protein
MRRLTHQHPAAFTTPCAAPACAPIVGRGARPGGNHLDALDRAESTGFDQGPRGANLAARAMLEIDREQTSQVRRGSNHGVRLGDLDGDRFSTSTCARAQGVEGERRVERMRRRT